MSSLDKIREYADRIESGESKESIKEGLSPSFIAGIDTELEKRKIKSENINENEQDSNIENGLWRELSHQDIVFARSCAEMGDEGLDVLKEILGGPIYIDEEKNIASKKRLDTILKDAKEYFRRKRSKLKDGDDYIIAQERLNIRKELEFVGQVNSVDLIDPNETYHISGDVEGVFCNASHGQDAFSITKNHETLCVTVCDGVSSHKGSGIVSSQLAQRISEESLLKDQKDVCNPDNLSLILKDISDEVGNVKDGGFTTLVTARIDLQNRSIEWTSIGDSPLLIVDTDDDGTISWEIVTEDSLINNTNYLDENNIAILSDQVTHCVGLKESDEASIPSQDKIKTGTVEYKKGRKLVLASDFLTKIMLFSPDVTRSQQKYWENITTQKDGIIPSDTKKRLMISAWHNITLKNEETFKKMWTKNSATGELMLNPLFILTLTSSEREEIFDMWKNKNVQTEDDITLMIIDLDTYF